MNDDEYIILFDQNGSPYIAHASLSEMRQRTAGALRSARSAVGSAAGAVKQGVGRGVRTTHKYIQKIEENGRTRYFYTQEELKAYLAEKKAGAQQTVNKAKEKARAGMGEAQEKASKARTRAEQIGNEFKNKASDTVQTAKRYGEAVKNYNDLSKADMSNRKEAYSKLMSTEEGRKLREAHRKVWDKLDETALKAASHLNGAKEYEAWKKANREYYEGGNQSEEAREKADKAWDAYSKTRHYKFLNDNFVANAQTNGLKDATSDVVESAKNKTRKAAQNAKNAVEDTVSDIKESATKAKEEIQQKLKDHNGSPSNSNSETRSMLGSYATEIPSSPDKLKEWADNGKQQAQQVIKEAEDALKEIEQGYKNGEYTQYQMWTAQNIVDGMHDEMEEWEFLSNMSGEELSNLFGPLLKSKKS